MDVPEHLAHLDRDDHGRPVPYVNAWGDVNDVSRYHIAADPYVDDLRSQFFTDDRNAGPNFLKQSPQRQREVTRLGRCQVCRRGIPWPERFLVLGPTLGLELIEALGTQMFATHEPWLCPECAAYVVQVCPGLIRRRRGGVLRLLHGFTEGSTLFSVSRGYIDGMPETLARDGEVVMFAKIVLPAALVERAVPEFARTAP